MSVESNRDFITIAIWRQDKCVAVKKGKALINDL